MQEVADRTADERHVRALARELQKLRTAGLSRKPTDDPLGPLGRPGYQLLVHAAGAAVHQMRTATPSVASWAFASAIVWRP